MEHIISLPLYPYRVEVSSKQRPKYFTYDKKTDLFKVGSKSLYKSYLLESTKPPTLFNLKYPAAVGIYKKNVLKCTTVEYSILDNIDTDVYDLRLVDISTLKPILANRSQAGKPKYVAINGQILYSQVGGQFTRVKIIDTIKDYMAKYMTLIPVINRYPIGIEYTLYDTVDFEIGRNQRWDVYNRLSPYMKAFPDMLVNGHNNMPPKLIDDDRTHLIGECYRFEPIDDANDRKIVIKIVENAG